jgi:FkbM family methyltransferase
MSSLKSSKTVKLPERFTGSFCYVDCGAAGDYSNRLLDIFRNSKFIGFDPELSQPLQKAKSSLYFPVAVGKETGVVQFHRTQNPNCSSIFVPNQEFLDHFVEVGEFFKIVETVSLNVVGLDAYLPQQKIMDIDFMELDVQGAELDVLNGAQNFLRNAVIGVKVEVEFAEMYHDQPLFGDVDRRLRELGFVLFDLERFHLRRKSGPPEVDSREQIVWGQALYLRDFHSFSVAPAIKKQKLAKLAMVASYYGFHSYALEVMNYLTQDAHLLVVEEKKELEHLSAQYFSELEGGRNRRLVGWMQSLDRSRFHTIFRRWGDILTRFYEAYQHVKRKQIYFWKD